MKSRLHKIEITNFKAFRQRHSARDLHDSSKQKASTGFLMFGTVHTSLTQKRQMK
jgi:hypothetical protein